MIWGVVGSTLLMRTHFKLALNRFSLGYRADMPEAYTLMNEGKRSGRSSYIGYHTNAEIDEAQQGTEGRYLSYTHRADIENDIVKRTIKRDDIDSSVKREVAEQIIAKFGDGVGEIMTYERSREALLVRPTRVQQG